MTVLDPLFGWEVTDRIFSDSFRIQRMLDFEGALAAAEARLSVIPKSAGPAISNHCKVDLFDLPSIAQAAATGGNLAIPLVKELTKLVAQSDEVASRYVHWGATSQDVIDTGLVLQLREAFDAIESELQKLAEKLAQLGARPSRDRSTRTHLDAARHSHRLRTESCRLAGCNDASSRALARDSRARTGPAIRRGSGNAGKSGVRWPESRANSGGGTWPLAACQCLGIRIATELPKSARRSRCWLVPWEKLLAMFRYRIRRKS